MALGQTSGRLTFLDTRAADADGEMEVAAFEYTEEEARFASFTEFLRDDLKLQLDIVRHERQGDSDADS